MSGYAGKQPKPITRRGIVVSEVSGWKVIRDKRDSDCQWLLYNPRGLRDGDEVALTFSLRHQERKVTRG